MINISSERPTGLSLLWQALFDVHLHSALVHYLWEKMGNNAVKGNNVQVTENILHLTDIQSKFYNLKIPLSRAMSVQLVPQFTTTDTPGRSVQYKLLLTFCNSNQNTGEYPDISIPSMASDSDDGETGLCHVVLQFTETVTRERRKSVVGIARRTSFIKYNKWIGKTNDILFDEKRIRIKGHLQQKIVDDSEDAALDLDLILCPSDLIIPETEKEWLMIGTLYLSNLKEKKDFKWRAAVSKDV